MNLILAASLNLTAACCRLSAGKCRMIAQLTNPSGLKLICLMYTEENRIVYPPTVVVFSQDWLKKKKVIKNITTQSVLVTNASG